MKHVDLDRDMDVSDKSTHPTSSGSQIHRKQCFSSSIELHKIGLCRSVIESLAEPARAVIEAIDLAQNVEGELGLEFLENIPSILDYYSSELGISGSRRVTEATTQASPMRHGVDDLSCESFYKLKKNENVEAVPVAGTVPTAPQDQASGVVGGPTAIDVSLPLDSLASSAIVKTTAEGGVSVAHSPCAYDLSGSVPWANYTTDSYMPLSVNDVRYHRVHLCSGNIDRPGSSVWKVLAPKQTSTPPVSVPRDGSCPFRNSAQLSLRDKSGEIILIEWVEQFPLLMHFHGMSGTLLRYFHNGGAASSSDSMGHGIKLDPATEFIPRVFGGSAIKLMPGDSSCPSVFESSLLRAPIVRHQPSKTDFLLVRSKSCPNAVLHPIRHLYVTGQAEPLYRVDVPVVPRLNQCLSARVLLECRRFWLKAKQLPNMDFAVRMFIGERRSLLSRYLADSVKEIQLKPSLSLSAPLSPEEACVINSMKEGVRRLAERGIERIFAISPMRIRNYVRDIEVFERSMPASSRTPRIAHLCAQLENEMRLSTWNLTNDYWDVMTGKRGAMFQFSPLGDPSGGRGEGISFRKVLKSDSSTSLSVIGGRASTTMEIDEIRSKSKKELIHELEKLNVPERVWKAMSRWQLMRQLALLLGLEDDSEERLAPWKRKALHGEKIMEAWKKQMKALNDAEPPEASHDELIKAAQAYKQYGLSDAAISGNATPIETPQDSGSGSSDDNEEHENLLESLLLDIQPTPEVEQSAKSLSKITRLEIVSAGRTKSTGNPWSQVTYVYGKKNIALYRKWKELEEESSEFPVPPQPNGWQDKVEMTLKVHRKFQRMIKQAAEAGRAIPDCKRCGACHLFGHDQSYEGCPVYVMDMNATGGAPQRKKRNIQEQSPIYD